MGKAFKQTHFLVHEKFMSADIKSVSPTLLALFALGSASSRKSQIMQRQEASSSCASRKALFLPRLFGWSEKAKQEMCLNLLEKTRSLTEESFNG